MCGLCSVSSKSVFVALANAITIPSHERHDLSDQQLLHCLAPPYQPFFQGNPPVTVGDPSNEAVSRKMFPLFNVVMVMLYAVSGHIEQGPTVLEITGVNPSRPLN